MVRWGSERLGGGFHQPLGTEDHSFRIFGDSQLGGSFHAGVVSMAGMALVA